MACLFTRAAFHPDLTYHGLTSPLSGLHLPGPRYYQRPRHTYQSRPAYRVSVQPWEPRFEARETEDSYVLYGELPGMNKDDITVEFPEARKIVVSGRVKRTLGHAATEPVEPVSPEPVTTEDIPEDTRSRSSYQATVEDDNEDDDFEVLSHTSDKSETEKPLQKQPESEPEVPKAEPKQQPTRPTEDQHSGYTVREFSRYFTFPEYVDHDFVTADLKDGLLTIMIPKASKSEPRRILIN